MLSLLPGSTRRSPSNAAGSQLLEVSEDVNIMSSSPYQSLLYLSIAVQLLVAIILFFCLPISQGQADKEFATIVDGKVLLRGSRGVTGDGHAFTRFLSLPYADPPIGQRRFARPEPARGNAATVDATRSPPMCLQPRLATADRVVMIGDENCLVLNVYTPDSCRHTNVTCPVLVFFHPGGFARLSGGPETFAPDVWMGKDVVLVAPNYRLGVLGFLSLDTREAPGNLGLWDQRMALIWVQKEISNFGGDPGCVTLMGSDSGGVSAILQMLSPANRGQGLFHRVISQSGSPVLDRLLRLSRPHGEFARDLAQAQGCKNGSDSNELLSCLVALDGADLQRRGLALFTKNFIGPAPSVWGSHYIPVPNPFVPVVDGHFLGEGGDAFLPDWPEHIISSGDYEKVPVLLGSNSQDGFDLMSGFLAHPAAFENFTELLPLLVFNKVDVTKKDMQLAEVVKRAYMKTQVHNHRFMMSQGIDLLSDLCFHGKVGAAVRIMASKSGPDDAPIFHYVYRYSATNSMGDLVAYLPWKLTFKLFLQQFGIGLNMRHGYGVVGGDELLQMFPFPNVLGGASRSQRDLAASANLLDAWISFARDGTPTTANGFVWEPSTPPQHRFASILTELKMAEDQRFWRRVDFFEQIMQNLEGELEQIIVEEAESVSTTADGKRVEL